MNSAIVLAAGSSTRMGNKMLRWSHKYMPDASIFAVVLTFIAFILGITLTDQGPPPANTTKRKS